MDKDDMLLTKTTMTATTTIFTIHTNIYKFDNLFNIRSIIFTIFTSHQYCTKS